jgi:hypothetical protein
MTTPSPQEASPSSAPTVLRLFPNVDPSKLFPQGNSQPYDHTYRASNGRENNCINASTPHGQQHAPGPDPNHPRVPIRSTLPFNPYKPHTTPGHIVLPCHINPCRVAALTWISPHNIAGLANKNYHGKELGFYTIDCKIIHACGYTKINTANIIGSYNDIIIVHKHIITNWEGRYTEGPQIDQIWEKGLPTFPRLHSLTVEVAVDWYDKLQKLLTIYLIPVTPLDCVMIKMGYEALCILGMGLSRYPAMACILMELLPCLLPHTDHEVTSLINMVRLESGNGYDLFWHILELTIPGFTPANPIIILVWHNEDIFGFAQAFLLHFCLQAKKGVYYDNQARSTAFLQSINESASIDNITKFLTCVNNYYSLDDDGYLPSNLCMMGLAHQLNKSAKTRARLALPRINRMAESQYNDIHFNVPIQGSPHCVFQMEGGRDAGGRDHPPSHVTHGG